MDQAVNVLAMVKGEEQYVFLYDDENRVETLRTLGRYAADPELSFTWYDAAVMSKKIRDLDASTETEPQTLPESGNPRFSYWHKGDLI